jgi:hypothetical protein
MPSKATAKKSESGAGRIGTRSENADAHPGIVVANSKRKRRTKAEMLADAEEKVRQKEAEQQKKAWGLKRIAEIEDGVAKQDTSNLVTPKPKPHPIRKAAVERTVSYLVPGADDRPTDGEEPSEFEEPQNDAPSELTTVPSEEEEEPLPKKKKVKVSMRDAIQAVREDVGNTLDIIDIDDAEPAIDKHGKKMAKRFDSTHMVFTLDETTIFYYTMTSSETASKIGAVKNWAAKTDVFSVPKSKNSSANFSSKSRGEAPSLTYGSSRSTKSSTLSNRILISSDRAHVEAVDNYSVNGDLQGGFVDEDEIHGVERDQAVSSPVKGKARATNQVCYTASRTCYQYF